MKADGNTNSNQTRWSQHTNPCHYRPPLRSFCASNSTSLLQRAQSALMLLCHHLAMLPCCHVIMFPCINIKYFKSTWNQCAWCLEAPKPLCVKCMCGSERPNCVCVSVCVACQKNTATLEKHVRPWYCWFTTSPNIWMLGSWPMPSDTAKPWRTKQPKESKEKLCLGMDRKKHSRATAKAKTTAAAAAAASN